MKDRTIPLPTAPLEGVTTTCSFCGRNLADCHFRAYSRDGYPAAGLCPTCLRRMSKLLTVADNCLTYWETMPDYLPLQRRIRQRLYLQPGSVLERRIAMALSIRLLQRASAIFLGDQQQNLEDAHCNKTGVYLGSPQIALIGKSATHCAELLASTSEVTGMPLVSATLEDFRSGRAVERLLDEVCNVPGWMYAAILVVAGYAETDRQDCAIIFTCERISAAMKNVRIIETDQ